MSQTKDNVRGQQRRHNKHVLTDLQTARQFFDLNDACKVSKSHYSSLGVPASSMPTPHYRATFCIRNRRRRLGHTGMLVASSSKPVAQAPACAAFAYTVTELRGPQFPKKRQRHFFPINAPIRQHNLMSWQTATVEELCPKTLPTTSPNVGRTWLLVSSAHCPRL